MNTLHLTAIFQIYLTTLTLASVLKIPKSGSIINNKNHMKRSIQSEYSDSAAGMNSSRGAVHQCALAKDGGWCSDHVTRWYFDTEYGDCLQFWYGGCDGNDNRFSSESACIAACRSPRQRHATCRLPAVAGPCSSSRQQWHYDTQRAACVTFVYSGCLGNDNRYDSREECETACGDLATSHTGESHHLTAHHGDYTIDNGGGREYTHHHHHYHQSVQATTSTTAATFTVTTITTPTSTYNSIQQPTPTTAPAERRSEVAERTSDASVCQLEDRQPGGCDRYIVRYSHVKAYRQCAPFYYSGCEGNANNFVSLAECQLTCSVPTSLQPSRQHEEDGADASPAGEQSDRDHRWLGVLQRTWFSHSDSESGEKRRQHNAGIPSSPAPPHEQQQHEAEVSRMTDSGADKDLPLRCWPDKDGGPCYQYLHRYFYDRQLGKCRQFIYGGCRGNHNRFDTLAECQQHCEAPGPPQAAHCHLPRAAGPCHHRLERFYFTNSPPGCRAFTYSGCGGNGNRFHTLDQCQAECMPHHYITRNSEDEEGRIDSNHITRNREEERRGKYDITRNREEKGRTDYDHRNTQRAEVDVSLSSRSSVQSNALSGSAVDTMTVPKTTNEVSDQQADYQYTDGDYYSNGEPASDYDYYENQY